MPDNTRGLTYTTKEGVTYTQGPEGEVTATGAGGEDIAVQQPTEVVEREEVKRREKATIEAEAVAETATPETAIPVVDDLVEVKVEQIPVTPEEQQEFYRATGELSPNTRTIISETGTPVQVRRVDAEALATGVLDFTPEQAARVQANIAERQAEQEKSIDDWITGQVSQGYAKSRIEAEQQLAEVQSGKYTAFMPDPKDPEDVSKGSFVPVWSDFVKQREQFGLKPEDIGEIAGGRYTIPNPKFDPKSPVSETNPATLATTKVGQQEWQDYDKKMQAVTPTITAKQAREQEVAKARAETLPAPQQTYTYREPSGKLRTVTEDERKAILDDKGWSSSYRDRFTKDIPAVQDVIREALSAFQENTMTFNRPELEKQYETQKEIALATFTGDRARLEELYKAGAFGRDDKIATWNYRDPVMGTVQITASDREKILAANPAAWDMMTTGRGTPTAPQAYKEALNTIQQQEDIEKAVRAGDSSRLTKLYERGAFGDDLAAYANLVKYVEEGGRELSPITSQDVQAVSESFGTKKEYVDEVLKKQPTTAGMAKDVAIAMVPVYGTIYSWDKMGSGMKAVSIATDALSLIPVVGGISAAAKVAAGVGRGARLVAATRVVPKLVAREVFAPLEAVAHPVQTVKAVGSTAKGLVNILNPRHIPGSTLSTVYGTVRLDTAILGDPVASMYVRDQLMALQAAGKKPVVQFGDKVFTLRSGTFIDEGGVVHASPNVRFVGEPEGFTITTKTYPEGHPKAGLRMPDAEQGLFVANTALERFAVGGSAFGFEKGSASATANIKAIQDAADTVRTAGDVKKADKLLKLVDNYNSAIAQKSVKALDKAEANITKTLSDMATDELVAKVNVARKTAYERYSIGDVKGAQEAMQEAMAWEKQLQAPRPGFAIFSPDIATITVPSGKTYKGMIFQPRPGEFWSITVTEMKKDGAAQLLQQAQDAKRLGDEATAARLTREAHDYIKGGKSGFRKVDTVEMELKFPELTKMQQMKPRYTTTASDTGAKLWIYTDKPYSFKKAMKAKLSAPIDTLRNIYDPAIKVRTIPMTRAQKLAKIDELLDQAVKAEKSGDATKGAILRSEADIFKRSLVAVKGIAKADDVAKAVARAKRVDDADELMQAAKRAETAGDYSSADRLRRAADVIAGRRYVNAIARRSGTVSGLAEYSRALMAIRDGDVREVATRTVGGRQPERLAHTSRDIGRAPTEVRRVGRTLDVRETTMREVRSLGLERESDITRVSRDAEPARVPDTGRLTREPETPRVPESPRVPRTPEAPRVPETPRVLPITRTPRIPETPRIPDEPRTPDRQRVPPGEIRTPGIDRPQPSAGVSSRTIPDGAIAWRQGIFWKYIPPPYNQLKPITLPKGVIPMGAVRTDLRTPAETVQLIGRSRTARVPQTVSTDLGTVDIRVSDGGSKISFSGRGLKTNVGTRISSTTEGMSVSGESDLTTTELEDADKIIQGQKGISRVTTRKEKPVRKKKKTDWLTDLTSVGRIR